MGSGNLIKLSFWLLCAVCKTRVIAACEPRHVSAMALFILYLDFLCTVELQTVELLSFVVRARLSCGLGPKTPWSGQTYTLKMETEARHGGARL